MMSCPTTAPADNGVESMTKMLTIFVLEMLFSRNNECSGTTSWQIAVPNGDYDVEVGLGLGLGLAPLSMPS